MEPEEGKASPLERARRRLYARKNPQSSPVEASSQAVPTEARSWAPEPVAAPQKHMSFGARFLIAAMGFFVLAAILALLILFLGGRSVSSDHIEITIDAPTSVDGGEKVPLRILVKNANPVDASEVTLSVDFPDGAYDAGADSKLLGHYSKTLGAISAGQSAQEEINAVFFGAEQQKITLPIKVEYGTANSNATFVKTTEYTLTITSAPVSVNVDVRPSVSSGQPFTLTARVRSNIQKPLTNTALRISYPSGFVVSASDPKPTAEALFPLGTLSPGEEKKVTISGRLTGEDGDQKVFKLYAGSLDESERALTRPEYTVRDVTVALTKSFLSTSLSINNSDSDTIVAQSGESMQAVLSWINTLTTSIADASIVVTLGGNALDEGSIDVLNGFYRSSDKMITFDKSSDNALRSISPGNTGHEAFSFASKNAKQLSSLRNPTITLSVGVGAKVSGQGAVENLSSVITKTIRIATDLTLSADAVYSRGPFNNSGSIPPVVDKETTYTVRWGVANSINSVADATVVATLPSYVQFTGKTNGNISYNETTREVTWNVGDMSAGTSQEGAFQIAFTPSSSQRGGTPVLIPQQTVHAFDRFAGKDVEAEALSISTELENDPAFHSGDGRVQ